MHGIHQGNHRIEQIAPGNPLVEKEGLGDRSGIGKAGRLDHYPDQLNYRPRAGRPDPQELDQVAAHRAAQMQPLFMATICSSPETSSSLSMPASPNSLDDGDLLAVALSEDPVEQRVVCRCRESR